ncbi:MAG: hypothetical protein IMZ52_02795 [Actinobacteria bacterium]|nr:hypothetical protein [Actinomycetota bacterium]MBE3114845.1 hypothetical protein [Actinomycetota bacterium]
MANLKYKSGDYVRILNPDKNMERYRNKVGKIIGVSSYAQTYPYDVNIFIPVRKGFNNLPFAEREIEVVTEDEAFLSMI